MNRCMSIAATALILGLIVTLLTGRTAVADDGAACNKFACHASAHKSGQTAHTGGSPRSSGDDNSARQHSAPSNSRPRGKREPTPREVNAKIARDNRKNVKISRANEEAFKRYQGKLRAWRNCAAPCSAAAPVAPNLQNELATGPAMVEGRRVAQNGQAAAPPVPALSPEQVAYIAVAKLRFPTTKPGIGPSPKINPWKMAAVGYPLWLWSAGPARVGPVSQTVADLSVSLEARVAKTVFRMGDGHTVTCSGVGKKWTRAVRPGQKSPTCGYSYQEPSLPKGSYTVEATTLWEVTWNVNDASGVITVPRSTTAQLPVGELQVLVR